MQCFRVTNSQPNEDGEVKRKKGMRKASSWWRTHEETMDCNLVFNENNDDEGVRERREGRGKHVKYHEVCYAMSAKGSPGRRGIGKALETKFFRFQSLTPPIHRDGTMDPDFGILPSYYPSPNFSFSGMRVLLCVCCASLLSPAARSRLEGERSF